MLYVNDISINLEEKKLKKRFQSTMNHKKHIVFGKDWKYNNNNNVLPNPFVTEPVFFLWYKTKNKQRFSIGILWTFLSPGNTTSSTASMYDVRTIFSPKSHPSRYTNIMSHFLQSAQPCGLIERLKEIKVMY